MLALPRGKKEERKRASQASFKNNGTYIFLRVQK